MRKLKEECGIFGIYNPAGDCAKDTYYGLVALQHRGQEGCGIAVNRNKEIYYHKDLGLVNDVFSENVFDKLQGNMAIGHVRYSTTGGNLRENVQPLVLRYIKGSLAIAHNGNLTNTDKLKKELEKNGAIFQTTSDTEIIAYLIARERINTSSIEEAVYNVMQILEGAYSLLVMSPNKLIAARDRWGFRPLSMAKKDDAIVFASETCAFDTIDAKFERNILPGEVVVIEDGNIRSNKNLCSDKSNLCIFEHIYFARPDSFLENELVHNVRKRAGEFLAKQNKVNADIVLGVPDSGLSAAEGFSKESGIPLQMGFIKNKYIARTFIKPNQKERDIAVRMKLNVLSDVVKDKSVVMVDDSIVRGTTSGRIVNLLRQAGAKEVHVRISSPPFLWPCFFGTDIPSREALIANNHSIEEIAKLINADSLDFLSLDNLEKIAPNSTSGFCKACFTGNYPINVEHLF